jgi:hypothetical protein
MVTGLSATVQDASLVSLIACAPRSPDEAE